MQTNRFSSSVLTLDCASAADVAPAAGLTPEQVERVFADIERKRRFASYLHAPPALVEEVG